MNDASRSLTDVLVTAKADPSSPRYGGFIVVARGDGYSHLPTNTPYADLEQIIGASTSATIVHRFIYAQSQWLEIGPDYRPQPASPNVRPIWWQPYGDDSLHTQPNSVQAPQWMSNHIYNAIRRGKYDKESHQLNGFIVITDGSMFSHLPTGNPQYEQDSAFNPRLHLPIVARFARPRGRWTRVAFIPPTIEPCDQ